MQIEIFNFAKEPNSTKQPSSSGGRSVSCVLKDDCSLMNPVFLLNNWQMTDNYLKWDSRYYWIDDIVIKSKDHAELHCREDVLATYKSYIGSSSQYIVRSSAAYTGTLIDSKYPALTAVTKVETELTSLHSNIHITDGFFIVGVQNGSSVETGGVSYYALGKTQFGNLLDFMYGGTWLDTSQQNISIALQKELINPMQYISSITWFPFSTDIYGMWPTEAVRFGWWSGSGVLGSRVPTDSVVQFSEQVSLPRHPNANARGSYLNALPFTRYTLFCYTFGQIPIDANLFSESGTAVILISVDLRTGDAKLTVSDGSARQIMMIPGKMGQEIPISQLTQSFTAPVANIVSGAVGMAYGNVVGVGQGIVSAIESMMPQLSVRGTTGSRNYYYKKPTILTEHRLIASEDNAHLGRPLCVRGTIQSYAGYNEVENADIDFACNFTELTEIKSFLEGGFYYE